MICLMKHDAHCLICREQSIIKSLLDADGTAESDAVPEHNNANGSEEEKTVQEKHARQAALRRF